MPNERFTTRVSSEIDSALLTFLKDRKDSKGETIRKSKNKTLNIKAGESIQYEELTKKNEDERETPQLNNDEKETMEIDSSEENYNEDNGDNISEISNDSDASNPLE